jgi:hypothetical protein
MDKRRPLLRLLATAIAICATALAAGCGGDDDAGDDNPRTLLGQAAAKKIDSADVRLRTDANIPGFPILGSRLVITGSGPVVANGPDALPTLDWDVMLRAGGQSFPARLTALDGRVYVEFMGTPYEADPELLARLGLDGTGSPGGASLKQLGLDPDGWLTRVEVSDGEEIGGDSTRLVTGTVDERAVLEDLLSIVDTERLEDAGEGVEGLPELNDENTDKVLDAIQDVDVEVNVDDDGYPRRVYAKLDFVVPKDVKDTAIEDGTVKFDLVLEQVGDVEVNTQAPVDPDPLASLFEFAGAIFGVDEPSDLWRRP